jgi:deoxyribose-phosphate aldolase
LIRDGDVITTTDHKVENADCAGRRKENGRKGADIEQVKLIREVLLSNIQIKASGGIQTYEQALTFIEVGATRLGTSSGVAILNGGIGYSGY